MPNEKKVVLVDVVALGRKGGEARAANMSPEQRKASAKKAAAARWASKRAGASS